METKPSSNKTVLIIVIAVVVVCCLCTVLVGGGAAAYYFLKPEASQAIPEFPAPPQEATVEIEPFEEPTEVFEFDRPEPTATVEERPLPTRVPTEPAQSGSFKGMGVTRDEMIAFFNAGDAFEFGEVFTIEGAELVMGYHKSLCIADNCAAVTLGGPADDLQVISVSVPTDPADTTQTSTAVALLMTASVYFTDTDGTDIAMDMITQILQAQAAGENLEKTYENNGYEFNLYYETGSHNASLVIARP